MSRDTKFYMNKTYGIVTIDLIIPRSTGLKYKRQPNFRKNVNHPLKSKIQSTGIIYFVGSIFPEKEY